MASLKESYRAQNSLELKLPSRSSPPFYAKQRTLTPGEKKMDFKVEYGISLPSIHFSHATYWNSEFSKSIEFALMWEPE